jgi:dihydroflavonol-4-reductase
MAVLVTGATGFVGSWLVRELLQRGEEVRVLHRPSSSMEELKGLNFVSRPGDVTDLDSLREACRGVDTVFHLAGVVGYSRAMRRQMEDVNVGGTKKVIEALQKSTKLVYMSSVVAVGASFDRTLLNESSPFNLHSLDLGYFETKKAAEDLVVDACRRGRIEAVILNPSTIYGAGDAKKGSRKTQVKVAQGKFPFYTSGGVSIVSVHDVVAAVLKAREVGVNGERYILSGDNITIEELFKKIAALAGVRPPSTHLPTLVVRGLGKVGDALEAIGKKGPINSENAWTSTLFHWFDHSKATRVLGFQPRPASVALQESIDWMREHGYLK